jgi:hypothetical protein
MNRQPPIVDPTFSSIFQGMLMQIVIKFTSKTFYFLLMHMTMKETCKI